MALRPLGILLLAGSLTCAASDIVRPTESTWMAEAGSSHLADTYLSPVKYSGSHFGLSYSSRRLSARPGLSTGWDVSVSFDRAKNPAGNATMLGGRVEGSWQMTRRYTLSRGIQLGVGGYASAELGALYLRRNGNNPAQAVASVTIGPQVFAQWSRSRYTLRLEATSPLAGAFFCPDYGELYYEISLGNRSGLTHFAWPGSFRRIKSLLSLDINLGNATLRLGYRLDATSSRANHITSRRVEHSAVVGISCDFITLYPRKPIKDAEILYY